MSFHPDDYLNDLNIDLGNDYGMMNEQTAVGDLAMFSQPEFFDLDVFSNDSVLPKKPVVGQKTQDHITPSPAISSAASPTSSVSSSRNSYEPHVKHEGSENLIGAYYDEEYVGSSGQGNFGAFQSANEDKRKRNTAASARFRIKKKMKEQQMEKESKELQEKVFSLEKKVKTLEMENKFLKNLVLQKNEKKNSALLQDIKQKSVSDSS